MSNRERIFTQMIFTGYWGLYKDFTHEIAKQ